ncbi:unnamed protein product [Parnassius apollo]|uniref:(apollo) hypothetical protein n=1 Tax=Parnassius apollo TaxID=110799 RepID=A0A8S3W9N3_PARAO|nr:unnamed protein product [Parnassius apollo]
MDVQLANNLSELEKMFGSRMCEYEKKLQKVNMEGNYPHTDLSSLAQFAIANVQCQYDSPSDNEPETERPAARPPDDHTYDLRDEPPAFIIHQVNHVPGLPPSAPFVEVRPKIMTIGPGYTPGVNVIHVGDPPQMSQPPPAEYNMNKRIRRSEVVLRQAADCVSRGLTFQTVSEKFNIPISTIRFFMARKGILPRRRRGRCAQVDESHEH